VNDVESLSHIQWECKYQLVFIPKYRKKALYGALRQQLGELLRRLATRGRVGSKKGI
jgi:putative transposase